MDLVELSTEPENNAGDVAILTRNIVDFQNIWRASNVLHLHHGESVAGCSGNEATKLQNFGMTFELFKLRPGTC